MLRPLYGSSSYSEPIKISHQERKIKKNFEGQSIVEVMWLHLKNVTEQMYVSQWQQVLDWELTNVDF